MAVSKVFIVTGASKGIGAAITQHLLGQSHKVVLSARSADLLETVKKSHPGQVEYVAGDMANSDMPQRIADLAVKSFGQIDGIVINHGVLVPDKLESATMEQVKHVYDINVFSCLAMAKVGIKELRKTKGCVLWVSSGAAVKGIMGWGAYGSSKAAVNSFSAHLAVEEDDIVSIAVAPGRVNTDMQAVLRSAGKDTMDKAVHGTFVEAFEQGTLLKPEQPGNVMARFVADPQKNLSGKFMSWNSPELEAYQA